MTRRVAAMALAASAAWLLQGCARSESPGDGWPGDGEGDGDGTAGDATDGLEEDADTTDVPVDPGDDDAPCAEATFTVSETQETFTVPPYAKYMYVKAWGAGGNGELGCDYANGGLGGFSAAVFEVTSGDPLIIIVGRRGRAGLSSEEIVRFGFGHWGGGGLTGVFRGPDLIDENDSLLAYVIAGGGGGASAPGCAPGGPGNHATAGGMPTMMGGAGADDVNGGAGGYRGGTGGAAGVGGKGGTGYVDPSAIDSLILGGEAGDAAPPRADDEDYDGTAGQTEQNGLIILRFVCDVPPII